MARDPKRPAPHADWETRAFWEGCERGEFDRGIDSELAAAVAIGAIDGLLLQHYVDRRAFGDRRALADALVGQLLRGWAP